LFLGVRLFWLPYFDSGLLLTGNVFWAGRAEFAAESLEMLCGFGAIRSAYQIK